MAQEVFLVTGASGCIGAWVLHHLTQEGVAVLASDLAPNTARPALLMDDATLARFQWLPLDVTDTEAVNRAVADNAVTHIIHLAGLQVPFCKANPPLGAAVNVTGTTNIFEAARRNDVQGLAYASSVAVFGTADKYPPGAVADDAPRLADTLYGVFKTANEDTARIYWQDWQTGSVGLRPAVVYGPGRDQGLTSDLAKATLAVAAGRPFHIRFGGVVTMQHAGDAAAMFIAAARARHRGALVCNMRNTVIDVADFVSLLNSEFSGADITHDADTLLPVPAEYDDRGLRRVIGDVPHTPLADAVRKDIARFRRLIAENKIDLGQLDV